VLRSIRWPTTSKRLTAKNIRTHVSRVEPDVFPEDEIRISKLYFVEHEDVQERFGYDPKTTHILPSRWHAKRTRLLKNKLIQWMQNRTNRGHCKIDCDSFNNKKRTFYRN